MATIVLTAVGSIFGPIGAAIGALAGQAIDAQIFKPAGRQGPRLSDLRVQTSSFGTQIPRLYGRMRVAGTVIWATDLREQAQTSGGGKGKPSVTSYSYSASFAVALSSRPIKGVGRIWADGNLLRGSAGDFKSGIAGFRAYGGQDDQPVDPLMAADRGWGKVPAHRGVTYVVFEGLQLADFGNRIPSMTFELFADDAPVAVSAILDDLAREGPTGFAGLDEPILGGYAATGDDAGEAIRPVLDGYGLLVRAEAGLLKLTDGLMDDALLRSEDDLRIARGKTLTAREMERKPVESVPRRLSVRHYDPDRDYQAGTQSAERQGAGWGEALVDLPATLDSARAQQRAADLLRRTMLGRRTISLARGWEALPLQPGDIVSLDDHGGRWRIETVEWEGMAVRLGLVGVSGQAARVPDAADGGSGVREPDRMIGPTHVTLVEVPQLSDTPVSEPQLYVAASGGSAAWRGAAILLRDGAGSYTPTGSIRRPAVMGVTLSRLATGSSGLFDMVSAVEVQLHDGDAVLSPVTDVALIGGANACLVGEELLQFGHVSQSGPSRYRLSRLLRGRRGTEHHMGGHRAGEGFLLLDADRLLPMASGRAVTGGVVALVAQGVGDATPAEAERVVDGRAMLPLSPVKLSAADDADGGLTVRWTRRSRLGWAWLDGTDAPLGEEGEAYGVEIRAGDKLIRSGDAFAPLWRYAPELLAADRDVAGGVPLSLSVRQRGTFGVGPAAYLSLPLFSQEPS
ncbi:MAG TPA: phage tail protein [Sphingobium sp.]|uniref:phage tail protein n=1 Tax=Sphingobium sp. TaxID=1912891 RepID=UPI002ED10635